MNFTNHFLIAMPHLTDMVFNKSLVFTCEHDDNGAMGVIINKPMPSEQVSEILIQTRLDRIDPHPEVYFGGPVGLNHGLILHDTTYQIQGSHKISEDLLLTTNSEIMNDILSGKGPGHYRFMVGYAGWTAGQLEREYENGDWLILPATSDFIFNTPDHLKWERAAKHFGIDIQDISGHTGFA